MGLMGGYSGGLKCGALNGAKKIKKGPHLFLAEIFGKIQEKGCRLILFHNSEKYSGKFRKNILKSFGKIL